MMGQYANTIEDLGHSKESLWEYFSGPHSKCIKKIHVEQDNPVNNIRRWLLGVMDYLQDAAMHVINQTIRIVKSDKITPPGLCVAVNHDIDELETLNFAFKSDIMKVF